MHLADIQNKRYEISDTVPAKEDQAIQDMIRPYKLQLDSIMDKVIGYNSAMMVKNKPESTLGNWLADIILKEAKLLYDKPIDFAVQNYGGIRVPNVPAGPLTIRTAYEVMPFDNAIVVIEAKGILIKSMFEKMARSGGWPISEGVACTISKKGELLEVLIQGEKLDNNKTYRFALPDYIANGGDNCSFLVNQKQIVLGMKIRDAIIHHLESKALDIQESPSIQGRFIIQE